jgi:glycosyltransferase involved in cell wall biosynthesis
MSHFSERRNIVVVGARSGIGGVQILSSIYSQALAALQYRCTLLFMKRRDMASCRDEFANLATYADFLRALCSLPKAQRDRSIVLVMPDSRARLLGLLLHLLKLAETLFVVDSAKSIVSLGGKGWRGRLTRIIERYVIKNCSAIATYQGIIDAARGKYARPDITLLRNPVLRRFAESEGRPRPVIRLLYIGRLEWEKGVDMLPQVAVFLLANGLRFELRIVGDGSCRTLLENAIARTAMPPHISLMPATLEPEVHFAWADILLLPSREEGPSLVAAEAMVAGVPVVCTPVQGRGPTETIGHDAGGITATSIDPGWIAIAILDCIREYEKYVNGCRSVARAYEFPDFCSGLKELIERDWTCLEEAKNNVSS